MQINIWLPYGTEDKGVDADEQDANRRFQFVNVENEDETVISWRGRITNELDEEDDDQIRSKGVEALISDDLNRGSIGRETEGRR